MGSKAKTKQFTGSCVVIHQWLLFAMQRAMEPPTGEERITQVWSGSLFVRRFTGTENVDRCYQEKNPQSQRY